MKKFILNISMQRSKKYFSQKYGDDWFYTFKKSSSQTWVFEIFASRICEVGPTVLSMIVDFQDRGG